MILVAYIYLAYFSDAREWMILVRHPHCWRFLFPLPFGQDEPSRVVAGICDIEIDLEIDQRILDRQRLAVDRDAELLTDMLVTNAARFGTEKAQEPLHRVHELRDKVLSFIGEVKKVRVIGKVTYQVHHRVANQWRRERAFLMGDAAHLITPMWALGINTGLLDCSNLCWRLAWYLRGWANERGRRL